MDKSGQQKVSWHSISVEAMLRRLKTNKDGISEKEARERLHKFGFNRLPEERPIPKIKIFFEQFKSPLIYILVIAGFITLALQDWTDSVVIFAAVFLNSIIGYFQENKTSQILSKLKRVVRDKAVIIRNGQKREINQNQITIGDIIVLSPGDKIPADARIIENLSLKVNESILTGEWLAADKSLEKLPEGTPLADRKNMVYMGTVVESGRGKAVVVDIGLHTEVGKIAVSLRALKEEKTPYQRKIANLSKIIAIIVGTICLVIFIGGAITGRNLLEMFVTAVAVAVAAIPEGLPVAITVILALGMERILKKKGLVRRMVAAEVLGSTSIICADKTGTLTQAKMQVSNILANTKEFPHELALKIGLLCSEAFVENIQDPMHKWIIRGQPTEKALLFAALQAGFRREELEKEQPRLDILSFDPVCKYSATLHEFSKTQDILYVLGAPEIILTKASYFETDKGREKLSEKKLKELTKKYEKLDSQGLRLLATAYRKINSNSLSADLKNQSGIEELSEATKQNLYKNYLKELVFVAFIVIRDPLREDVKEAINLCVRAGMKPIIITGDHRLTARAVAEELGLPVKDKNIIEGQDLEKMSDEDFKKRLKDISIYARMEPQQKLRIVQAWQEKGEVLAITGDGVNDAPALKQADIGVALGSGTDVAKEASDLVLLTDSFSIIVTAVEEGRGIVDNIRKTVTLQVSQCFSEIILIGASIIGGFPLPILPAQILWENLIEGSPQGIALAFEPKEKDIMKRAPEDPKSSLLTQEMRTIIFGFGIVTDLILLGLFLWLLNKTLPLAEIRTVIFAVLAVDSIFYGFSCKNLRKNIWEYNPFSNLYLIGGMVFSLFMLLMAVYIPLFQNLLKTVSLNAFDWFLILVLGLINLVLIEVVKFFFIRIKKLQ